MKIICLVFVAFLTFSASGIAAHFYNRSDDLSLRYILWKKGLHPYPSEIIHYAVLSDNNRDELIRGKSKEEIRNIFPDTREALDSQMQKQYENELAGREYLWLGEYGVIIFLNNGIGDYITIMKG
jgi:hypothetical protein